MITMNELGVIRPWDEKSAVPLIGRKSPNHVGARFNSLLRHRRNQSIDMKDAITSISLSETSKDLRTGRLSSSRSLSSNTSCSSDDNELSEGLAISEARTLFGFLYPLLLCLLISFVLLPAQLFFYNISGGYTQQEHSYLSGNRRRDLVDSITFDRDTFVVEKQPNVDAVVFVAIGPTSTSPVLGWSVNSVVQIGRWNGAVYIVTDRPEDVERTLKPVDTSPSSHTLRPEKLHIVPYLVDMPSSLISFNAKLMKCSLLKILPKHLQTIVYIDSDIVVGKPLAPFWKSVFKLWDVDENPQDLDLLDDDDSLRDFKGGIEKDNVSLGLFEDGKAFTAGFCKDCDTWNTGVMSISRGKSDSCLNAWCETLLLHGGTDQAALDNVIAAGSECQNIHALDRQHVRMMKDVFVVCGMVGTKTFNHFTGIFRPQNLSRLHRRFYERILGKDLGEVAKGCHIDSFCSSKVKTE